MKFSHCWKKGVPLLLAGSGALLCPPSARADYVGDVTAVCSRVSDDYVRARQANGAFQVEYYAFGEGGKWGGASMDPTIDNSKFLQVAKVIAGPLSSQNYRPARTAAETQLLLMVYWGTTTGTSRSSNSMAFQNMSASQHVDAPLPGQRPSGPGSVQQFDDSTFALVSVMNRLRDKANWRNARMLGYDEAGVIGTDYGQNLQGTALHLKRDDLVDEIEENRYFVVLMAYDFQLLAKEKKHKLVWETRFSIREPRNDFAAVLPAMAQYASRYFGQDSHGLIRKPVQAHVTLEELRVLEYEPVPK